jgi:DNA-binding NtrC family response regulator
MTEGESGARRRGAVDDGLRGDETILLVEDEADIRTLVADSLRAHGYRVLESEHGEDALEVAGVHAQPIDLVLTDVIMPEMSGSALAKKLREWYPRLRVLFISGYTAGEVTVRQIRDEQTMFVPKPFTMTQIVRAVRDLLDRGGA